MKKLPDLLSSPLEVQNQKLHLQKTYLVANTPAWFRNISRILSHTHSFGFDLIICNEIDSGLNFYSIEGGSGLEILEHPLGSP
jgi:hypothetical protein